MEQTQIAPNVGSDVGLPDGDMTERLATLEAENADLKERAFHRQQTTALKLERMATWARERLSEEHKEQFFNIYANGVEDIHEQPTAAQMMNMLKHERDALAVQVRTMNGDPARLRWRTDKPAEDGWYFYRWNPCAAIQIYQIGKDITGRRFAWRAEYPRMISEMPGLWAGPLKLPLMYYETESGNN